MDRAVRGTSAPVSNNAIPAAPVGNWQGVVDQTGPGSHVLYRDITLPDEQFLLSLTVWYRNHAGEFHTPRRLTVGTNENQQLRIDLVDPGAPIRSMEADDILANVMRTRVGDPSRMRPGEVRRGPHAVRRSDDQAADRRGRQPQLLQRRHRRRPPGRGALPAELQLRAGSPRTGQAGRVWQESSP